MSLFFVSWPVAVQKIVNAFNIMDSDRNVNDDLQILILCKNVILSFNYKNRRVLFDIKSLVCVKCWYMQLVLVLQNNQ